MLTYKELTPHCAHVTEKTVALCLPFKGDPEDAQEPIPEAAPGSVSVGNLSVTSQDEDRSGESNLPSSSSSDSAPHRPCFKEDAGEDTALLGMRLQL